MALAGGGAAGAGEAFVSDIFNEVDEEVRREQLKKLWERYGILIIALAVLFVAAVGGWRGYQWWEAKKAAEAGAAFEAAVDAQRAGQARGGGSGLRQDRGRRHRRAIACWPSCARRRSWRGAIPRPRSRSTTRSRPTAASARCCAISRRCAPAYLLVDTASYDELQDAGSSR